MVSVVRLSLVHKHTSIITNISTFIITYSIYIKIQNTYNILEQYTIPHKTQLEKSFHHVFISKFKALRIFSNKTQLGKNFVDTNKKK